MAEKVDQLLEQMKDALRVDGDAVQVVDEAALRDKIDQLINQAVFGQGLVRETARWLIWEAAQALGIKPASIHELYMAIGRGDVPTDFTVPAMNVRGINFVMSRAIFRAANKMNVGSMLFEIARSEIGYTDQRPAEYVAAVLAAAIKEGFRGPVFFQGDHFQISASRYKENAKKEVESLKTLMTEAVEAGFYNIDIDTSTLVTLEPESLEEQQRLNYEVCAALTQYARSLEPDGITISLGGEIGEVGGHNSTVPELDAFMSGYIATLPADVAGISKISVQTGTSHGGVVLPDGTLAEVNVDFETLGELGRVARESYGLGGAVQHGASTLPEDAFSKFPEVGTVEIHLATGFQNMIFDYAPEALVQASYDYVNEHFAGERKANQTADQFIYSTRKKAFGSMKQQWWEMADEDRARIGKALQDQFEFLFTQLNVGNTKRYVAATVDAPTLHRPRPTEVAEEADLDIAHDLSD
ncbi:MAG: class II fructose-bisphosphate aldolase [Anaerolineales bacterium]|nr:class II fructose-bisphosphate aldolase [Anaerolineales bacterium]MCB9128637.1 class II fructose-bisphosphate aldolase [Ardenticatenales bacterium]